MEFDGMQRHRFVVRFNVLPDGLVVAFEPRPAAALFVQFGRMDRSIPPFGLTLPADWVDTLIGNVGDAVHAFATLAPFDSLLGPIGVRGDLFGIRIEVPPIPYLGGLGVVALQPDGSHLWRSVGRVDLSILRALLSALESARFITGALHHYPKRRIP